MHLGLQRCIGFDLSQPWLHDTKDCKSPITSAIGVTDVGEPPDVAEVHREAHHGEEELDLLAPHLPHLSLDDHLWCSFKLEML